MCNIRQFCVSDVRAVCELIHLTLDVSYSEAYPPRAVQFFKDYHSEAKIIERYNKGEIFILEKDGKLIGTGSIVGVDILGVFVHPEFQHHGLGKALMKELEKKAITNGISEVALNVSLPSRKFYENLGYEIIEEHTKDVGEGQQLHYWEAKKTLMKGES
jgi:GNAT superfamily N-acetyltransferase